MTQNEVEWVIDQLASVVDRQPDAHPLRRVNRDVSRIYDLDGSADRSASKRSIEADPQAANTVGVASADRSTEYVGTDPNLRVEQVVSVRVVGHTSTNFGHTDPDGADGVAFTGTGSLVRQIRKALYDGLKYPDAGPPGLTYCDLRIENETNLTANYADDFRYQFDVRFIGYEDPTYRAGQYGTTYGSFYGGV
jgi:hypothetical protein